MPGGTIAINDSPYVELKNYSKQSSGSCKFNILLTFTFNAIQSHPSSFPYAYFGG